MKMWVPGLKTIKNFEDNDSGAFDGAQGAFKFEVLCNGRGHVLRKAALLAVDPAS